MERKIVTEGEGIKNGFQYFINTWKEPWSKRESCLLAPLYHTLKGRSPLLLRRFQLLQSDKIKWKPTNLRGLSLG